MDLFFFCVEAHKINRKPYHDVTMVCWLLKRISTHRKLQFCNAIGSDLSQGADTMTTSDVTLACMGKYFPLSYWRGRNRFSS